MSSLSHHQSVFHITKPSVPNDGAHSGARKRNRQAVSCAACRARKLKCDRQLPCTGCAKRGDSDSCIYANDNTSDRSHRDGTPRTSEAQFRLQRLESIVTSLMQMPSDSGRPQNECNAEEAGMECVNMPQVISSGGHLDMRGSESNYFGNTHWTTILENIREIQGVLETTSDDNDQIDSSTPIDGADIVFGSLQPLTMNEACKSLPPRSTVDRMLAVYFNAKQIQFLGLTHTGKFLREYESFWADASSVSLLWMSMLFSILFISSRIEQAKTFDGSVYTNEISQNIYFTRARQALIAGEYQKGKPYSVESVTIYGMCKYTQCDDPDSDVWMIMGVATRLAVKMGYHRDPRHLGQVSAFEGEMRRRVFFYVQTFDLILSFSAGLPAMIREEECDVDPPSNLWDSDFDEDCEVLPPSRPPTDPTPMLYYCTKDRLLRVFRSVFRLAMSFESHAYADILKLDKELDEVRSSIPPTLRPKPLSSSIVDPPDLIVNRRHLETMYLKVLCVLHRKYLTHDRSNPNFQYSRDRCTSAALRLLEYQMELQIACRPGGQLYEERWMLSSINQQNFLLAAMIICLDFYEVAKSPEFASSEERASQSKKQELLKRAYDIWVSFGDLSREAQRAAKVISALLSKVQRPDMAFTPSASSRSNPTSLGSILSEPGLTNVSIALISPEDLIHGESASNDSVREQMHASFDSLQVNMSCVNPLDTLFDTSDNFDWALLDQGFFDRLQNVDQNFQL
ncbi:hypothetical protein AAFC00_004498 [Neodothiora populina]|uniref:Zn(2)-C6 fungal-type domain-containing protein n=1 Tax=Neodothiora populina TaxID=2781224 RepID=A0ABR3P2J8_9PEZI